MYRSPVFFFVILLLQLQHLQSYRFQKLCSLVARQSGTPRACCCTRDVSVLWRFAASFGANLPTRYLHALEKKIPSVKKNRLGSKVMMIEGKTSWEMVSLACLCGMLWWQFFLLARSSTFLHPRLPFSLMLCQLYIGAGVWIPSHLLPCCSLQLHVTLPW